MQECGVAEMLAHDPRQVRQLLLLGSLRRLVVDALDRTGEPREDVVLADPSPAQDEDEVGSRTVPHGGELTPFGIAIPDGRWLVRLDPCGVKLPVLEVPRLEVGWAAGRGQAHGEGSKMRRRTRPRPSHS